MTMFSGNIVAAEIAAAIADAVIQDIRVNSSGLDGMPEINVRRAPGRADEFLAVLKFGDFEEVVWLSEKESKAAIAAMKAEKSQSRELFDRVQRAFASLEGSWINRKR